MTGTVRIDGRDAADNPLVRACAAVRLEQIRQIVANADKAPWWFLLPPEAHGFVVPSRAARRKAAAEWRKGASDERRV